MVTINRTQPCVTALDRHSRGAVDHVVVLVKHGYAVRTVETTPKNRTWGCGRPDSLRLWTVAWSRGNGDAPSGACYMMMMTPTKLLAPSLLY